MAKGLTKNRLCPGGSLGGNYGPDSTYSRKLYVIDKEFQFGYLMSWPMMVLGTVGGWPR